MRAVPNTGRDWRAPLDASERDRQEPGTARSDRPKSPLCMSAAIKRFGVRQHDNNKPRTVQDQKRLLQNLVGYIIDAHPELGSDPRVHEIDTALLSGFIDTQCARSGKRPSTGGEPQQAAARTVIKKIRDLRQFFEYACHEVQPCTGNPVAALDKRLAGLEKKAATQKASYRRSMTPDSPPSSSPLHTWPPIVRPTTSGVR